MTAGVTNVPLGCLVPLPLALLCCPLIAYQSFFVHCQLFFQHLRKAKFFLNTNYFKIKLDKTYIFCLSRVLCILSFPPASESKEASGKMHFPQSESMHFSPSALEQGNSKIYIYAFCKGPYFCFCKPSLHRARA